MGLIKEAFEMRLLKQLKSLQSAVRRLVASPVLHSRFALQDTEESL